VTHEEAFLTDILLNPEDDALRLIFADWLDDHGRPERAEFIRTQVALARRATDDPVRPALEERVADLLADHGTHWRAPLDALGVTRAEFKRGHIEEVCFSRAAPAESVRAVLRAAPVRQLRLWEADLVCILDLARSQEMARLRELTVRSRPRHRIGPTGAAALAASPHLGGLESLAVCGDPIGLGGVRALVAPRAFPALRELTLHCADLGDDSAFVLAQSPLLGRLRVLNLGWNQLTPAGLAAILASPGCAGLERLGLDDNSFNDAQPARLLAGARHLTRLAELDLGCSRLGTEGAAALASAPRLASVRRLMVQHCGLGDDGVRILSRSPHLAGLRELWLCNNGLTAAGVAALGRATFWPGLRKLTLNDDGLTDDALEAMSDSPALNELMIWSAPVTRRGLGAIAGKSLHALERLDLSRLGLNGGDALRRLLSGPGLSALKSLRLSENGLDADGATALAASPRLAGLTCLSLTDEGIGAEGARSLALSPNAAGLRQLHLCGCEIGDEGAAALADSPYLGGLRELELYRNGISLSGAERLRTRFGVRVRLVVQ
jgi:uncharacterized protein (TIGR02996 family)